MIDVFISRPTWTAEEFREGLEGFLSFLETHDLKPRTVGSTDYPTEVPMDEVITLMDECEGAIILGYPQIQVIRGKIKDSEKNDFSLPTEWNHIEATLAYAKNMPLLVIHHKGIDKGIFERGATSKFIYETDLTKTNWFLSENISRALMRLKALITQLHDKKSGVTMTVPTPLKSSPERLDESVETVLVYLFASSTSHQRTFDAIRNKLGYPAQATTYCLKKLREEKMITTVGDLLSGYYYNLTDKGREYVMTNKLMPSPERLDESVEAVLVHLFASSTSRQRTFDAIRNKLGYPAQATTYCLKKLREEKMITTAGDLLSGYYYNLTDKGREYVITNKLITF